MSFGVATARRSKLGWMLVPVGAGLLYCAARKRRRSSEDMAVSVPFGEGVCIETTVLINKSPEELYNFWRDLPNLSRFVKQLKEIHILDNMHSHWVIQGPAAQILEWNAEIVNEIPNQLIGWRTLEGADLAHAGSVHFDPAPHGRGTIVKVEIQYQPPVNRMGDAMAKVLGQDPGQIIKENLIRFKELMETGEIATIEGQPRGSRNVLSKFAP